MKVKPLFLTVFLLLALIGVLEIKPALAADYVISLTLLEDCEVRSPVPDTNFGSDPYIFAINTTTGNKERFSYLKFNLTEIPLGNIIINATLYIYHTDSVPPSGYANINVKPVENQTWLESLITWNNRPTVNNTILDTDGTNATITWWDWNLTDYVNEQYLEGTDANISTAHVNNHVSYAGWTGAYFRSSEYVGSFAPQLNVTYSVIAADETPPLYLYPFGLNSTLNGSICQFTVNFTDETALSHAFLSWNNSGSWANVSYTLAGTVDLALWNQTLNATSGYRIEYLFYVNDTSDNWNTTVQHFIYTNTKPIVLVISDAGVLFIGFLIVLSLCGSIIIIGRRKQ